MLSVATQDVVFIVSLIGTAIFLFSQPKHKPTYRVVRVGKLGLYNKER